MREKFRRDLARLEHCLALTGRGPGYVILGQSHAVFFRERPDRLRKGEPLDARDEIENAAADAASEAMEESALGIHRERWRFLIVKRTQADEVAPRATKAHVRADNLDDIGARTNFLDFVVAETSHQPPITVRNRSGKFV